ncbi:MAG TPA: hypothetical protein VFB02_13925 [Bradyrhizobium sp.]|nr:hypothetical protein [Bradyrhizobium sp.]
MYRIDNSTNVGSRPTPAAPGSAGYFTQGDPTTGVGGTILDADWANAVQEELIAVVLAAGLSPSKTALNQLLTAIQTLGRVKLTAATTFYVNASTGSDSNTGLDSGHAWQTIQHAINVLATDYDLNGQTVTIQLADGTYGSFQVWGKFLGQSQAAAQVIINGNAGAPSNVLISSSTTTISARAHAAFRLQNLKVASTDGTGATSCVSSQEAAIIEIGTGFVMGANSPNGQHFNVDIGGIIDIIANYQIAGAAGSHYWGGNNGNIIVESGLTITITGSPSFSGAFAWISRGTGLDLRNGSQNFTGSMTGQRYFVSSNGVISVYGMGPNVLPGSIAGATSTGGEYN